MEDDGHVCGTLAQGEQIDTTVAVDGCVGQIWSQMDGENGWHAASGLIGSGRGRARRQ